MIHFETERLILRNYTMDDVPAVHEYFSNEEVSRYEDFWPMTVEEVAECLSRSKDRDNRMAVVLKETGELIGSVGYWVYEEDERNLASARLLERLGFELIETVDDAYKEDADGNPIMIRSRVYKLTV